MIKMCFDPVRKTCLAIALLLLAFLVSCGPDDAPTAGAGPSAGANDGDVSGIRTDTSPGVSQPTPSAGGSPNISAPSPSQSPNLPGGGDEDPAGTASPDAPQSWVENGLLSYPAAQREPGDIERRDGAYVLAPYAKGVFFSDYDVTGEGSGDDPRDIYGFVDRYIPDGLWASTVDYYIADASSCLQSDANGQYRPDSIMTRLSDTAWAEGADGYGTGDYVEIDYTVGKAGNFVYESLFKDTDPVQQPGYIPDQFSFTALCIVNGYAREERLWRDYSRVKTLKLYVDGQLYAWLELEDTIDPQFFPLYNLTGLQTLSTVFRLEIADVYPGDRYDSTCITGIELAVSGMN